MRIVSLTPAATEILFALGLGEDVVGVTHACEPPADANDLPRVTRLAADPPLDDRSAQYGATEYRASADRHAKARPTDAHDGDECDHPYRALRLDRDRLEETDPDLIVTDANARTHDLTGPEVRELAEEMLTQPLVIALDPHTLGEVLGDVRTLAEATSTKDEGVDIIREASDRIDRIRLKVRRSRRPRVVALQSLDPPLPAGHWLPQLIELAGGEDVLGFAGEEPEPLDWQMVALAEPDLVLVMPAHLDAPLAYREAEMFRDQLLAAGAGEIIALDSARYFAEPGLRLIDGLEILAAVIHPELVEPNPEHAGAALTVEL